ncbi:helix-turn-helix transcriptional regulator [Saccharothrix coeruleofusca]|uniref:helix-turn-helix transcriptional regulator n=1 Tax=Saccharothrix coeruleofusca TaxID=33919 RepID=UPI0016705BB9|nr:helix-turn-helix transcriptional regulator [Saccharothrix coeruleofusca]
MEVRRNGGHLLAVRRRQWDGVSLELARWRPGSDPEALLQLPDHLVFVTFSGRTERTEAAIGDGPRYRGADFPGAVTFLPAGQRRRAWHAGGRIEYGAIRLAPRFDGEPVGFTNQPDPLVWQLALALRDEARGGGAGGALFVDSVATALGLHLLRRRPERAGRATALAGARLGRVIGFIDEHLADDLRLAALAAQAGLGVDRFGRAFKAATGVPPHRYVTRRRVERAAELLARTDLPIAEIAHRVGLSGQSHLTTLFRRAFGDTPHAYRLDRRLP